MPQPALISQAASDLTRVFRDAWTAIVNEQVAILRDPVRFRRQARLRELRAEVERQMDLVDSRAQSWVRNQLRTVYANGGVAGEVASSFEWTQTHVDALFSLQNDTMDSVLRATRYVRRDTKRFIREMSKQQVFQQITLGETATRTGLNIERILQEHGIQAVRYSNGSRHGLREYGQMLARTKSAEAYNTGTITQGMRDTKFWEILDGPECGLVAHDDGQTADGMIVTSNDAFKYLISHPNCRRSFGPRPDLDKQPAGQRPSTTAAQRKDIRQADRARRELRLQSKRTRSQRRRKIR